MEGMNSGTTDELAWPVLRDGTDVASVVTDGESHNSVQYLHTRGINAGPCGAATLAALQKLCQTDILKDKSEMVAVLFSTEGNREYEAPE